MEVKYIVSKKINSNKEDILTPSIHIIYILSMRSVDVAKQLQEVYSYQIATYKVVT